MFDIFNMLKREEHKGRKAGDPRDHHRRYSGYGPDHRSLLHGDRHALSGYPPASRGESIEEPVLSTAWTAMS